MSKSLEELVVICATLLYLIVALPTPAGQAAAAAQHIVKAVFDSLAALGPVRLPYLALAIVTLIMGVRHLK